MKNFHSVKDNVKRMKSQARVCSVTSVVSDCVTPRTAVHQAALSMGFYRQEYWSGLPFPSPRPASGRKYLQRDTSDKGLILINKELLKFNKKMKISI